jgi:hypothetical protein
MGPDFWSILQTTGGILVHFFAFNTLVKKLLSIEGILKEIEARMIEVELRGKETRGIH